MRDVENNIRWKKRIYQGILLLQTTNIIEKCPQGIMIDKF